MSNESKRGFTTSILHSDRDAVIEHGALHKPLHLSVAYGYKDANDLAAVFQGRQSGYAYGRQGNPTSAALEAKVTAMEGGVGTVTFATGMAAIGAIAMSLRERLGDTGFRKQASASSSLSAGAKVVGTPDAPRAHDGSPRGGRGNDGS